jgi:hypothetical protein
LVNHGSAVDFRSSWSPVPAQALDEELRSARWMSSLIGVARGSHAFTSDPMLSSAPMLSRRSEVFAFAAALCLHAAALWLLRVTLVDPISSPRSATPSVSEVTFDIDFGERAGADEPHRAERGSREVAEQTVARFVARPGVRDPELDSVLPETPDSVETVEPDLEQSPEEQAPSKPIDLGIGPDGWQRWAKAPKPGEAPRAESPAVRANRFQVFRAPPVSTSGGLQEGLEERDRALGLGPSGRVLSALHRAAHATVAPEVGTARFDVTVLRTGAVEVTLGAASGEVEKWRKVAAHVADDLRAAPPKIAPPREGVRLVVELVAEETMPNGTKVKSLKRRHVEVTPPKLESAERSMEKLDADNPTMKDPSADIAPTKLDLPGVYLAERGKVCSNRVGVGPMGHGPRLPVTLGPVVQGACDPSHLGATPQRMVRARVLDQTLF